MWCNVRLAASFDLGIVCDGEGVCKVRMRADGDDLSALSAEYICRLSVSTVLGPGVADGRRD